MPIKRTNRQKKNKSVFSLNVRRSLVARLGLPFFIPFKDEYLKKEDLNAVVEVFRKNKAIKATAISRLGDVGSFRGERLFSNLPVRGQRTHTNSKTRRKWGIK
jgi:ribosomal protein S13